MKGSRNNFEDRPRDASGTGDAVWVVPSTEYVSQPARTSLRQLLGGAGALAVIEDAITSFQTPLAPEIEAAAIEQARDILAALHADGSEV